MSADAPAPSTVRPTGAADSATPRVDAAERHFYTAGAPPQGYVMSEVARQLELELARALDLLRAKGIQMPSPGGEASPAPEPASDAGPAPPQ